MSDGSMHGYPVDPAGYGAARPDPGWPGGARLALQISVLAADPLRPAAGDAATAEDAPEQRLERSRRRGAAARRDRGYGARVGLHRLRGLLRAASLPATWFFEPSLAERLPELVRGLAGEGDEIAALGTPADLQAGADGVAQARDRLAAIAGTAPCGWRSLRRHPDGRRALAGAGGFLYDGDAADDDLPYWAVAGGSGLLVLPATPLAGRGGAAIGRALAFARGEAAQRPQMLRLELRPGLHGRPDAADLLAAALAGLPGRADLWRASAAAIARHWQDRFPFAWT